MISPRDPPATCFPTLAPQHALFITTNTDFPYFAPTSCLRLFPFPFPCVVWPSLPGVQVCRAVLVAASTIPDPSTRPCHTRKGKQNGGYGRVPSGFRLKSPATTSAISSRHVGVGYLILIPSGAPSGASCQSWLAGHHATSLAPALHALVGHMLDPWHSLHLLLWRLCSHICDPTHSLHWFFRRL